MSIPQSGKTKTSEIERHLEQVKGMLGTFDFTIEDRAALTFFIGVGNKLATPGEIEKILLDTCEKELNQSIGFMLTTNDARIFARSLLNELGGGK